MYYAFPKNYFYKVETREDFDLNHKGEIIEWDNGTERVEQPSIIKSTKEAVKNLPLKYNSDSKLYEELDDDYVMDEVSKK